jgi:CelD/BcsL family acetyltransferase involved in cellulose biosynthesis
LLGVTELYEPSDLVYADAAGLAALAETLAHMGLPLQLGRLPADSPSIAALERACKGWVTTARVSNCPYIELDAGWSNPEQQFNAGRRSDLRRAERNASKLGRVTYEMVLSPSPHELNGLLDEAYRVEAAGWKGEGGSAMAVDELRGAFFRTYAAAACRRGILRLCFMRIDGQAVAMQLAVECGARFWLFKIGHDERFARCSPGSLLMLYTVRYAALRGLRRYEFLGAEAPWTQGWTRTGRATVSLRSYPPSVQGSAALSMDAANRIGMSLQRFLRTRA